MQYKVCKLDRDYTSRTFVEIYFNWDYFKMKKVLLIDEQKLKIVFNGTGQVKNQDSLVESCFDYQYIFRYIG